MNTNTTSGQDGAGLEVTLGLPSDPPAARSATARRRLGRFIVGHATLHHDWRSLLPLMAQVVILRAESLYHLDGIEYLALAEAFDEIEMSEQPPLYDVACRYNEQNKEVFTFTRRNAAA
jgi:hypothetical protein